MTFTSERSRQFLETVVYCGRFINISCTIFKEDVEFASFSYAKLYQF